MLLQCSDPCVEVVAALIKAQGDMGPATKGATNPHFRSSYADLGDVVTALRGPLGANGLGWVHAPSLDVATGVVTVETRIFHTSGQWIACAPSAVSRDLGPQLVGSLITYLKRYGLQALTGLPSEDDDGNTAQGAKQRTAESAPKAKAKKQTDPEYVNDHDRDIIMDHAVQRASELGNFTPEEIIARCLKTGGSVDQIPRVYLGQFLDKILAFRPITLPPPPESDLAEAIGLPLPGTINHETGEVH